MMRVNSRKTAEQGKPGAGESMRGGLNPSYWRRSGDIPQNFFLKSVSENTFQAILKSKIPYSITSILN